PSNCPVLRAAERPGDDDDIVANSRVWAERDVAPETGEVVPHCAVDHRIPTYHGDVLGDGSLHDHAAAQGDDVAVTRLTRRHPNRAAVAGRAVGPGGKRK